MKKAFDYVSSCVSVFLGAKGVKWARGTRGPESVSATRGCALKHKDKHEVTTFTENIVIRTKPIRTSALTSVPETHFTLLNISLYRV